MGTTVAPLREVNPADVARSENSALNAYEHQAKLGGELVRKVWRVEMRSRRNRQRQRDCEPGDDADPPSIVDPHEPGIVTLARSAPGWAVLAPSGGLRHHRGIERS